MRAIVVCLALAWLGCGDDDGTGPGDAGGFDSGPAGDAGPRDAGPAGRPDVGPLEYPSCDPLSPPSTCMPGERCAYVASGSIRGTGAFECRLDEGLAEGEDCELTFYSVDMNRRFVFRDNCATGTACAVEVVADLPTRRCRRVCTLAADCESGEVCRVLGQGVVDAAPLGRIGTCTVPSACDPVAGGACPGARGTCGYAMTTEGTFFPDCVPPGPNAEGEPCIIEACAEGSSCLIGLDETGTAQFEGDSARCRVPCDPDGAASCPGDTTCTRVPLAGGGETGICRRSEVTVGGARPARLVVPDSYDGATPLPLLVLLHGFGGDGLFMEDWLGLTSEVQSRGVFLLTPNGTADPWANRFWNATSACCDYEGSGVDDSAYLRGLIDEVVAAYEIDTARVYVAGLSNGAFMSYRMACDHADAVTAIVPHAGMTFADEMDCAASRPVSVLHTHGDMDATISYAGGTTRLGTYPGAVESVERWATRAGCDPMATMDGTPLDLAEDVDGDETIPRRYTTGCAAGIDVQLWTMRGAGHVPDMGPGYAREIMDWLLARSR